MSRKFGLTIILLAFLLLLGGASVAGDNPTLAASEHVESDTTRIEISLDESGDAVWTVTYRILLEDEADREGFEDLRADIEANSSEYEAQYQERMQNSASSASEATGRDMAIENMQVSVDTRELPESHGVVEYNFRWTNFAATEDGDLVVGDAIDGLFLDEQTVLLISWPEDSRLESVSPPGEERDHAVVWEGPIEFGTGEPRVNIGEERLVSMNQALSFVGLLVLAGLLVLGWLVVVREWRPLGERADGDTSTAEDAVDPALLSNEE